MPDNDKKIDNSGVRSDKKNKWCVVCGRLISPLSYRRKTCGEYCCRIYKRGYSPYIDGPKPNSVAEVQIKAAEQGLSYGKYVAKEEYPVIIKKNKQADTKEREMTIMPMYMFCPFYKRDVYLKLHCEGSTLMFPNATARLDFVNGFCANEQNWRKCAIAQYMMQYHDRKEKEN